MSDQEQDQTPPAPNPPSQSAASTRGQLPSDYPEVMELTPAYCNWFLGQGTSDGTVRLVLGESFDSKDEFVVGHVAVALPLTTVVKLHQFLGAAIKALVDVKTRDLQNKVAQVLAAQSPDGVVPQNKQN